MIDLTHTRVIKLTTHYIGNASFEENSILSKEARNVSEELSFKIIEYLTAPLMGRDDYYHLSHEVALEENLVYRELQRFFSDDDSFLDVSQVLADYLFDKSNHPRILTGYLTMVHLEDILVDDELVSAIALLKSETINEFFQFEVEGEGFGINLQEGYGLDSLDKAFLCLNTWSDQGYLCLSYDVKNHKEVAHFWSNDFLNLKPVSNAYFQTAELMKMAKSFVTEELPENFSVPKPDQIDMLNRSADYFKTQPQFDRNEFVNNVFDDLDVQESFSSYQEQYEEAHQTQVPDQFEISQRAVQKNAKVFKSILKLDGNFHVYIHGDRSKIELGREVDGRKFYKIYFEEER